MTEIIGSVEPIGRPKKTDAELNAEIGHMLLKLFAKKFAVSMVTYFVVRGISNVIERRMDGRQF